MKTVIAWRQMGVAQLTLRGADGGSPLLVQTLQPAAHRDVVLVYEGQCAEAEGQITVAGSELQAVQQRVRGATGQQGLELHQG